MVGGLGPAADAYRGVAVAGALRPRAVAEVRAVAPGITVPVGGLAFREDPERFALTGADAGITDAVASARLRAPVLPMAEERWLRTVPSDR